MTYREMVDFFVETAKRLKCIHGQSLDYHRGLRFRFGSYEAYLHCVEEIPCLSWYSIDRGNSSIDRFLNPSRREIYNLLCSFKDCFRRDIGLLSMRYDRSDTLTFFSLGKSHDFPVGEKLFGLLMSCRRENCTVGQILDYLQENYEVPEWIIKTYQEEVGDEVGR